MRDFLDQSIQAAGGELPIRIALNFEAAKTYPATLLAIDDLGVLTRFEDQVRCHPWSSVRTISITDTGAE